MMVRNPRLIQNRYARWVVYGLVLAWAVLFLSDKSLSFSSDNGFDLTDPLVPRDEIHHGGPPRDGIPAINNPRFVNANEATFLNADDRILGLVFGKVVRAYPIKILNYHEIVNDIANAQAIVITYCPLCGSGMAFQPGPDQIDNPFGVSGLLYNSDMLLYDRQTESLWSQIMGKAISGKMKGATLTSLPLTATTWENWAKSHPDTEVLSTRTGYYRNYDRHPYGDYDSGRAIYFPVSNASTRYHPKERVLGITINGKTKAYPFVELSKKQQARIQDQFAGQKLIIEYDAASQSAVIYDAQNRLLPATMLFWFAWYAFHPETEVFN